jgi:hypothetical protein
MATNIPGYTGLPSRTPRTGFGMDALVQFVQNATVSAKTKLAELQSRKSAISIADMFDMQMLMNHLSQLSEMTSAVVGASNQAIQSMARKISQ